MHDALLVHTHKLYISVLVPYVVQFFNYGRLWTASGDMFLVYLFKKRVSVQRKDTFTK